MGKAQESRCCLAEIERRDRFLGIKLVTLGGRQGPDPQVAGSLTRNP